MSDRSLLLDDRNVPPHKTAYDLVMEATPSVSGPPVDCTNACEYGDCDCSGVAVVVGWRVDVPALRVLLAPQVDE